jgi:kynurenine---oxoglutarate transaminase / cysteine-S-conjugate beta-lyase / glutamine---phenylpyruvate transaminase
MYIVGSHQYVRAFGSLNYTKAIADFHKKTFGNLDHENNIVTANGGVEGLYCCIMGLVNQGEEVIVFDPSYDCYRPQVQMAGGKTIGIPLKPKKSVQFIIIKHTK